MIASPQSRHLRVAIGVAVVFLVCAFVWLRPSWRDSSLGYAHHTYESVTSYLSDDRGSYNGNQTGGANGLAATDGCAHLDDAEGVVLVLKTGATEVFERIPTHLLTTLKCVPDFLLFSDLEQQMGPHRIYDALADIQPEVTDNNPEFDLYRAQQECPTNQRDCLQPWKDSRDAWNMDKYKFLPIMEQTWRKRPGREWYIFAEADSFVFWGNILHWLRHEAPVSPQERVYFGSKSFIGGVPFAHGGSGYVLSGALLEHLIEDHPGAIEQYNLNGMHECCGDLMLAKALDEYEGIKIRHAWPMFNGEKPITLPYGPGHWCEPILTMHHVNAEEIAQAWHYEQSRGPGNIILIRDLYEDLVAPHMQSEREDWDNLSDDVCYVNPDPKAQQKAEDFERDRQPKEEDMTEIEKNAWKSPDHCAKVCESEGSSSTLDPLNRQCFQYHWHKEVCCTSRSFKMGGPKAQLFKDDPTDVWMSGWYLDGIDEWIEAKGDCGGPQWKVPDDP